MRADSDFSPAVAALLDRYTPVPETEPDWEAIRARDVTSQRRARRRLVPLAAALAAIVLALAVVTPLGRCG